MSQFVRRAENAYEAYQRSELRTLRDAYGRFSYKKQKAWDECSLLCRENNGHDLKIITHNTYMFTAGFEFEDENGPAFMYITPSGYIAVGV